MQLLEESTFADPLAGPVRYSNLRYMGVSPAHYRAHILHPREQTPAMRFGALVHALVLGGEVTVWDGERRGRDWAQFRAENDGALIVTRSEHDRAIEIADAIRTHERAAAILSGDRELEIQWQIGDRACVSHLDALGGDTLEGIVLGELKTTTCVEPYKFKRACLGMSYHGQLGMYADAAQDIGRPVSSAFIVGVEVSPPYAITILRLTPRALEAGRKLYRGWLERLRVCEENDSWPAYCQADVDFDVEEDVSVQIDGEDWPL